MPLSEFANRGRRASTNHHTHTGHGRRDQLTAGERTRILRMLRDEGGRMADEDSQVYLGVPPAPAGRDYDFDFDDNAPVAPPVAARPDVPAKPAVVVGLDKARRQKRGSGPPPLPGGQSRATQARPAPAKTAPARRAPLPKPFEEPTRAVNDAELVKAVRSAPGPGRVASPFDDLPTRLGDIDAKLLDDHAVDEALQGMVTGDKFIASVTEPQSMLFDDNEATSLADLDGSLKQASGGAKPPRRDEQTRAVDIRNDPSMSDVDWDID
jgi:hypothetical protein